MSPTQLELFNATVNHQQHEQILFYPSFTPDLEQRVRQKYELDDQVDLRDFFGMFNPQQVLVERDNNQLSEFDQYYQNVDYIMTGDDVASQISLIFGIDQWRKVIKPRWAKAYSAARAIKPDIEIWYHSDGNISEIIPELIAIGVTILNPIQPECLDLVMVKSNYGDKLVLDGTLGTQTTMPFGSVEDVQNVMKENASKLGYDGGLIFSPTHVLEPEVPPENIVAFVETAQPN